MKEIIKHYLNGEGQIFQLPLTGTTVAICLRSGYFKYAKLTALSGGFVGSQIPTAKFYPSQDIAFWLDATDIVVPAFLNGEKGTVKFGPYVEFTFKEGTDYEVNICLGYRELALDLLQQIFFVAKTDTFEQDGIRGGYYFDGTEYYFEFFKQQIY